MRKFLRKSVWLFLFIFFVISIFKTEFYRFFSPSPIKSDYKETLLDLSSEALSTSDDPSAAIVVYKDKIIGTGYNTVFRSSDAGGFAEINAISDAFKTVGFRNFMSLNRDSLYLISTSEPSNMSKDAIALYKIENVEFLKPEPLLSWLYADAGNFLYEFNKRQIVSTAMRDSLAQMRPESYQSSY